MDILTLNGIGNDVEARGVGTVMILDVRGGAGESELFEAEFGRLVQEGCQADQDGGDCNERGHG